MAQLHDAVHGAEVAHLKCSNFDICMLFSFSPTLLSVVSFIFNIFQSTVYTTNSQFSIMLQFIHWESLAVEIKATNSDIYSIYIYIYTIGYNIPMRFFWLFSSFS